MTGFSRWSVPLTVLALLGSLLLLVAPGAQALLTLDAITVDKGTTTLTSTSLTHETPSGSNRLLLVTVYWDDGGDADVSSISYDGNSLTCLSEAERADSVGTQICYLTSPPTGSNSLDVSWTVSVAEWGIVARSLSDVDQDNPIGATTTSNGSSTDGTADLTTNEADSVIATSLAAVDGTISLSPASGMNEDAEKSAGLVSTGMTFGAGRTNTTTSGTYTSGWSLSDTKDWALALVEIRRTPEKVSFAQSSSSGSESTGSPSIEVQLDRGSNESIDVDYGPDGGNASSDDHNVSSSTLTIPANTTSTTVDLDITGDDRDEPDETLKITLSNPSGAEKGSPTTHTYTINDDDSNHAPSPSGVSVSTDEDTSVSDSVSATDQDQNDTIDSYDVDSSPSHGSVSLDSSNGDFTYTPDADYNGADSFTFTATDEHGATSANATVNVTVNAVNDAPSASDDSATTDEDDAVWVDVLADDSDVDGDTLSVASATSPSDGTTTVPGNGTVKYAPDADFNGADSFDYNISDGSLTASGTVNVTVNAVNDAPSPSDDSNSTDENQTVWIDVLWNDSDPEGDSLSIDSAASPSNGTTSLPGNGTVEYTPDSGFTGDDPFDYTVSDGSKTATATVSMSVTSPSNSVPSASDDSASTDEDAPVWIDVLSNDSDPDGDTLSVDSTTSPSHGSITVASNDSIKYTPDANYSGSDSFDYDASDGSVTDTATVSLTVNAVNDAPSASADSASTSKDQTVWVDVLANDADVDGDSLSVASATSPSNGTTSIPGNGTVEYTPDAGFSGTDGFGYTVSDGSTTDTAQVSVSVGSGGGGPGGAEVLSSNVRIISGSMTSDPTLNTMASGSSLFFQLENGTGGIELGTLGASNDTTIEINLTTNNFTPTVLMGRTQVVDWSNTTNANGTQNVSLTMQPISMAFIDDCSTYSKFMGYCGPSSPSKWPTNSSEDQADIAFDAGMRVFLSDLSYADNETQSDLQGAYLTTDAQALGQMNVTPADQPGGPSLKIGVAGPHLLPNGTQNQGFFEARLPDALLDSWGIPNPSRLTGQYQGSNRTVEITNVSKGTKVRMDIHYSSGDVNITEDTTDPVARTDVDNKTVTAGNQVSFDGSNSTDNQAVTNYNWTFDDGANATGATVNHTFDSAGDYSVTLNVSDAAGNWDETTVNVTVEAASTSGGGGGGFTSDDSEESEETNDESEDDSSSSEAAEKDEESTTSGGSGWDGAGTTTATTASVVETDSQISKIAGTSHPSDSSADSTDSSSSEEGATEAGAQGRLSDDGLQLGVWIVWMLLIPASLLAFRQMR